MKTDLIQGPNAGVETKSKVEGFRLGSHIAEMLHSDLIWKKKNLKSKKKNPLFAMIAEKHGKICKLNVTLL